MRKWIAFALFITIIVGLNWLLPRLVRPTPQAGSTQAQMDEYMLGAKAIRFDKAGKISEYLELEAVYHIQGEPYMILELPQLTLQRENLSWHVKANSGKSYFNKSNAFEKIDLQNEVEVTIIKDDPTPWRMHTDRLLVFPQEEIASTQSPVSIFSGPLLMESLGMEGDLKQGVIQLTKEVTSFYEIPMR